MIKCVTKKRKNATKLGAKGTTYKICYKPKRKTVEPIRRSIRLKQKKARRANAAPTTPTFY